MTPTLAMVVLRDAQIAAFRPEPFWTVQITAGGIQPRLPSLAPAEQFTLTASSPRFRQKEAAEDLATRCLKDGKAMIRTVETKKSWRSPRFFTT